MKKSWIGKVVGVAAILMFGASTVQADPNFEFEDPDFSHSFAIAFGINGTHIPVDLVAVRAVGDTFKTGGFFTVSQGAAYDVNPAGWDTFVDSPSIAAAQGPSLYLDEGTLWANAIWDNPLRDIVWDIVFFEEGDQSATYSYRMQATLDGHGALIPSFVGLDYWNPDRGDFQPIPLPASAGMAAFGLIGLAGFSIARRRFVA